MGSKGSKHNENETQDEDLVFIDINDQDALGANRSDKVEDIELEDSEEQYSEEYVEEIIEEENAGFGRSFLEMLKYFGIIAVSMIFWECIMASQLGGVNASTFFFLFFIPAQAIFLTAFCGIGNNKLSRIFMPIILMLPAAYYIAQVIYQKCFGSLFSVSQIGMGNEVVGNFAWTVADVITSALIAIIISLLPVIFAIIIAIFNPFKLKKYHVGVHFIALAAAVALWFAGILGIRAFGTDRLSPYYLFTSASAVTDTSAKKLGTLTTGIVESGTYFFGFGTTESVGFVEEFEEDAEYELEENKIVVNDVESVSEDTVEEEAAVVSTPWVNEGIDFSKIADEASDEELKTLASYFATRKPTTTNEYTGMFEGYNLIYICAESFWSYACNEEVTPTLYKMANNGIVLNNYYNSFYNTTTNGEFAFATSLWPDVSRYSKNGTDIGSFAQSSTKYMPQGLGDLFTAQGIPSYAFHNYYGKYYRRILSWPNLGYKCRFTGDNMWFTSNWPASDLELMQQTVDDYINDDQFHAYYMTFSGHGPYTAKNSMYNKNIGYVNGITGTDKYNDMARGYLAGEVELDLAMEYLIDRLEKAGKLDNTVIVLTGDHYPYYLEESARDSLTGYAVEDDFDMYHSNCIIYNGGMSEPMMVDNYCCNIDIAPTMLNLFNIPYDSRMMIGRDIFAKEAHNRATLYNKSFITDKVEYNYETGEAVWSANASNMSDDDKAQYIEKQLGSIENEYTASCKAIDDNFFLTVYKMAGLLSPQEVAEEVAREERAQAQDDTFNIEDEAEKAAKEAAEQALVQQQTQDIPLGIVFDPVTGQFIDAAGNVVDGTGLAVDAAGNVINAVDQPVEAVDGQEVIDPNAIVPDVQQDQPIVDNVVPDANAQLPVVDEAVVVPDQAVVIQ